MLAEAREEIRLFVCQIGDDEGMSLGSSLVLQEEISLMGIPSSKMREVGSFCQTIFLDGGILFTWNDNNFSFVEKAACGRDLYDVFAFGVASAEQSSAEESGGENPALRDGGGTEQNH